MHVSTLVHEEGQAAGGDHPPGLAVTNEGSHERREQTEFHDFVEQGVEPPPKRGLDPAEPGQVAVGEIERDRSVNQHRRRDPANECRDHYDRHRRHDARRARPRGDGVRADARPGKRPCETRSDGNDQAPRDGVRGVALERRGRAIEVRAVADRPDRIGKPAAPPRSLPERPRVTHLLELDDHVAGLCGDGFDQLEHRRQPVGLQMRDNRCAGLRVHHECRPGRHASQYAPVSDQERGIVEWGRGKKRPGRSPPGVNDQSRQVSPRWRS